MKKFATIMIAALIMAFSSVTAFAASVNSPQANPNNSSNVQSPVAKPDNSGTSPQTGASDVALYAIIALSAVGCVATSVALVKSAKKN